MIKKQRNINFGAAILFIIFSLLFFILFCRFFFIQITGEVKGQPLAAKAEQIYSDTTKIEAKRGKIYDRNGELIAEDRTSYNLIAILSEEMTTDLKKPNHVVDLKKTASELSEVIELEESKIYKILEDGQEKGRFQVEFGSAGRDISYEKKLQIEELKLPGITFMRDMKRFYPNGVFASHVVGYTEKVTNEKNETTTQGKLGLEKSLDPILSGKDGSYQFESDLWGYLLPGGKEKITPAVDGKDVYLTIDRKIQILLEDALNKAHAEYQPQKMIGIVASAKTGEILAMAQRPTFDPETRSGLEKSWYNEAIETPFEPGSTIKIFTLAAAVEEGVFNPNEWFQSGKYKVSPNSKAISDHNGGRGWGTISYLEGVQRSSNVLFAKLANEKLGFDKLYDYFVKFGFDRPTGIDLPNEKAGKIVYQYPIEKATTSFGQGTTVTAIQQVQAATAIANDGKMMQTHVVDKIVDPITGDTVKETKPKVVDTPISESTAAEVRDYLSTVVTGEHGSGKQYAIDGYEVVGKTGTAQIPGNGGYLTGSSNYIFSFLGMAPKDDPELIVYVAVQQPKINYYGDGSKPVAMVFNPVMKSSLQYLKIQPKDEEFIEKVSVPDVNGLTSDEAVTKLSEAGLNPIVIGNGTKIVSQIPLKEEVLMAGEKVIIKTDGEMTAPNMTGWSIRDVMKVAEAANMKLNYVGNGYVVNQNLKQGAVMKEGEYLIVDLNSLPDKRETVEEQGEAHENAEETADENEAQAQGEMTD
jgi:penicillin-binding protein 2B